MSLVRGLRLGIVGHEAAKFTPETREKAQQRMHEIACALGATTIVSGHSPLGGVDIWAEELAAGLRLPTIIHAPKVPVWGAPGGFRDRNLAIARDSDLVLCIVVRTLPATYRGMRFSGCYHCKGRNPEHVKSGGCWTAWRCAQHCWEII